MDARSRHVPLQQEIVILRVGGTTSADVDAERSRLPESLSVTLRSSSARYAGAVPCRQRKTSTASLNSLRSMKVTEQRSDMLVLPYRKDQSSSGVHD